MPQVRLFHYPKSRYLSKDAIGYASDVEKTRLNPSCNDQLITLIHGRSEHPRNGEYGTQGAWDDVAYNHRKPLLKPLLTGTDRRPNSRGWCIGDIGIVGDGSGTFEKGAIVQLYRDPDLDNLAIFAPVVGDMTQSFICCDGQPGAYTTYKAVKRIELPDHLKEPSMSATSTRIRGDYVDTRQLTDDQLWAFIEDCQKADSNLYLETRSCEQMRRYVDNLDCRYVGWDNDDTI